MSTDLDELVLEIRENARKDRETIRKVFEKVSESEIPDPLAITALAENVSRLADSLTRVDMRLVELAKMRSKTAGRKTPEEEEGDRNSMFDEIEDGDSRETEEEVN